MSGDKNNDVSTGTEPFDIRQKINSVLYPMKFLFPGKKAVICPLRAVLPIQSGTKARIRLKCHLAPFFLI